MGTGRRSHREKGSCMLSILGQRERVDKGVRTEGTSWAGRAVFRLMGLQPHQVLELSLGGLGPWTNTPSVPKSINTGIDS